MKTFEEVYPTLPGNGWLTEDEARLLWEFAGQFEGPVLEVGCYEGRSSVLLANLGRPLYCVDPFDGFLEERSGDETCKRWMDNLLNGEFPNVSLARLKVEDWLVVPIGFAYLDGDHTPNGTARQIERAVECGAKGLAVHDVNDSGDGEKIKGVALTMLGPWETRVERLATWRVKK